MLTIREMRWGFPILDRTMTELGSKRMKCNDPCCETLPKVFLEKNGSDQGEDRVGLAPYSSRELCDEGGRILVVSFCSSFSNTELGTASRGKTDGEVCRPPYLHDLPNTWRKFDGTAAPTRSHVDSSRSISCLIHQNCMQCEIDSQNCVHNSDSGIWCRGTHWGSAMKKSSCGNLLERSLGNRQTATDVEVR